MANKKRINVIIPEHDDKALEMLNDYGLGIYTYAKFEGNHIIGYQKWGRGWRKDIIKIVEE